MKPDEKAFPSALPPYHEGMTIRAYIATAALQGILANIAKDSIYIPSPDDATRMALQYADALIEKL